MFAQLSLHKQLIKALDRLGFSDATDVQQKAIPPALAGKDLLVSAETGSGKTAAFLLPLLDKMLNHDAPNSSTRALILLPTRELALQTLQACEQLMAFTPIKAGIIVGGEAFKHQVAMLRKNPEIIIATPGRLVEHIERATTDFTDIEFLVLDEADRMLDMGFSEDLSTIAKGCNKERQNLLFSATLKQGVKHIADTLLDDAESIVVHNPRTVNAAIKQTMHLADDSKHKDALTLALLQQLFTAEQEENTQEQSIRHGDKTKAMVFCNTRHQCNQLASWLDYKKLKCGVLHSEIAQSERKQILNRFRQGHLQVLVTTDVAARGLDIQGISLIVHYDVPRSGDDYVHRSGRTARAGETGTAVLLVTANEWDTMSRIERYLKVRFELFKLEGLAAKYKGPKKIKKSGKAAGKKKVAGKTINKKKTDKKSAAKPKSKTKANKQKRFEAPDEAPRDGFAPLRRKK